MPEPSLPLAVRAGVLGGLYLVQGLVFGTGGLVLLPQLAAAGASLEHQIGISMLAALPWVLKLAWAPLLDAPLARRIGAGRIAAVAMVTIAAAFAVIAGIDAPAHAVVPLAVMWLAINAALSLQDVAADALAFDELRPRERGTAIAVMLGGHHLGAELLAGAWIGAIAATRGLGVALVVLSVVVLALASLGFALPGAQPRPRALVMPALRSLARDRRGGWALLLSALVFVGDVATSAVTGELLVVRLGWSQIELAERIPTPLLLGSLVGFASAALLADRIGHLRIARVGTIALGACWVGFALLEAAWSQPRFVQGFVVVQAISTAWLYAAFQTLLLDVTHPQLRATQLAVLTATLNLARLWVPPLVLLVVPRLGLTGLFVLCGAWQLALAWPLGRLRRAASDAVAAPGD